MGPAKASEVSSGAFALAGTSSSGWKFSDGNKEKRYADQRTLVIHASQPGVVSRLAPTPSGYLHLGNAVNFVLTWLFTRRADGTLHLRIDDLDWQRVRPAYLDNIFQTIEWLGLDYDEGPSGPADFTANYSQLHQATAYQALLAELGQIPTLLYACCCSRTDIQRTGGEHDAQTCQAQQLPLSAPEVAWRARVPPLLIIEFQDWWQQQVAVPLAAAMGDFVVRRKDGVAAYQLASLADDLRLGTTFIVRGVDLLPSTAAQVWLAAQVPHARGFDQIRFAHHALLPGPDGQKLSKSTQASAQRGIMANAGRPQVVYATVAQLLGLSPTAGSSLAALVEAVGRS